MERSYESSKVILETMKKRHSCRVFQDKEIPKEILKDIIATGIRAASGGNLQPYSIITISDKERKEELSKICANQQFIRNAAVNLLFLLDWHKYDIYTREKRAPFACNRTYMHYIIGIEDVMCAAQSIETAAFLCGIGSCYVGTVVDAAREIGEFLKLPKLTYPVVMLSLGYPKQEGRLQEKLSQEVMVFNEEYGDLSNMDIINAYDEKYQGKLMPLPQEEKLRTEALENFREALLTTYSMDEADEILEEANITGFINETQRRFGLHYNASFMIEERKKNIEDLKEMGFHPFGD